MKSSFVLAMLGICLAVMGGGHAIAASPTLPVKAIIHQLGTANGFGYGLEVCPIGCELPAPPDGSGDAPPFDQPDPPPPNCGLSVSWTHNFLADLPAGATIIEALLVVNIAGLEPDVFASVLTADRLTFPLFGFDQFDQGPLGSGPIPIPLNIDDLADGELVVTITKGRIIQLPGGRVVTLCDDQYYDTSVLVVLVQLP